MSREKMEERLRESNERYRLLLDRTLEEIWFTAYEEPIDITLPEMEIARLMNETGIIVEANNAAAKGYGFDEASQFIGRHWSEFIPFKENEELYLKFVRSNYNIRGDTSVETDREGNICHVENSIVGNIVNGKLVSSFGVGRDVTRRVQAEEAQRESEAFLHEVHHRIRNNLQVISSLLDMSRLRAHEQQAIDLLTDARTRLYTISIIHSQLYQNKNLSQIEMGFHVRELAKYLTQTYASGRNITIAIEIRNIYLPLSQATPCALAMSELISNALKHAFTEAQRGTIEISMRRSDEDMIIARVKDDGIGIPDENTIYKADSLGLKLCRNLIQKQLKGQIQMRRNKGTEFIIEFKLRGEEMKYK